MTRFIRSRLAAALVGLLAAGCLTACGPSGPVVTILGTWVGAEEQAFRQVLDAAGIRYDYEGSRAPGALLQSRLQKGAPPDIVLLPTIGELAPYIESGRVRPLGTLLKDELGNFSAPWVQQVEGGRGLDNYWVPIKADLKSIVWYDPDHPPLPGLPASWSWAQLSRLTWCIGVGDTPNSGWPASDWIEDLLLHQSGPDVYQQWATGQSGAVVPPPAWSSKKVTAAWQAWGDLLAGLPDHGSAALFTDQGDAARGMYGEQPPCQLEHQASFAINPPLPDLDRAGRGDPPRHRDFVALPPVATPAPAPAREVSADVASLFTDSPQARKMIEFLASDKGQAIWPANASDPAFSVDRSPALPPDLYGRPDPDGKTGARFDVAAVLHGSDLLCLDAGDLMPATMRDAFYRGLLDYMSAVAAGKRERLTTILAELDEVQMPLRTGRSLGLQACGSAS